jgi:branched-chain amino acid transport system permease protein
VPYLRLVIPGMALVLGFVGLVELLSFLTIGAAQGKRFILFGNEIDVKAAAPWVISGASLLIGGVWLKFEAGHFHRVWEDLTADLRQRR